MNRGLIIWTLSDRIRFWARNKAHALSYNPFAGDARPLAIPLSQPAVRTGNGLSRHDTKRSSHDHNPQSSKAATSNAVVDNRDPDVPPPAPPPERNSTPTIDEAEARSDNILVRFYRTTKIILLSSWINALLVLVPIGIAVKATHASPTAVFVINAIAIVPLAGLLSFATESVAREMGDTVGALMNVTFGNAVELIIL